MPAGKAVFLFEGIFKTGESRERIVIGEIFNALTKKFFSFPILHIKILMNFINIVQKNQKNHSGGNIDELFQPGGMESICSKSVRT